MPSTALLSSAAPPASRGGRRRSGCDAVVSRCALGGCAAALLAVAPPACAFGPQTVPLEVTAWADEPCKGASKAGVRCIRVTADVDSEASKSAFNSEVFGRVRYADGESALWSDFAEASDAGKIGDIPAEIKPGKSIVEFVLRLEAGRDDTDLQFVGIRARTYPGMRQDFRVMAPVTEDELDPYADEDVVP